MEAGRVASHFVSRPSGWVPLGGLPVALLAAALSLCGCAAPSGSFAASAPAPAPGARTGVGEARYTLTFGAAQPGSVEVEALLPQGGEQVQLAQDPNAPGEGWGGYVRNLAAYDGYGKPLTVTADGSARWRVAAPPGQPVLLRYRFVSGHESEQWGNLGAFARAYALDDAVFFAGRAMFVAPSNGPDAPVRLHFRLPPGWSVATAYEPVGGASDRYTVPNLARLWREGTLVGRLYQRRIGSGGLDVRIATPARTRATADLFAASLGKVLSAFSAEMGGSPSGRLTIMASVGPWADGGEAFDRSISMMFRTPPSLATSPRWATLLAHEAFHLWNGTSTRGARSLVPVDPAEVQWFIEGFTDYTAKVSVHRLGLVSEEAFLRQIAIARDRYLAAAGTVSMRTAGAEKGRNNRLLYAGGFIVALALDVDLHERGAAGLPTFMRRMQSEFGDRGKRYSYGDLVRVAADIGGADAAGFFAAHVAGAEKIDVDDYLRRLGLEVQAAPSGSAIRRGSGAAARERALFDRLFGPFPRRALSGGRAAPRG